MRMQLRFVFADNGFPSTSARLSRQLSDWMCSPTCMRSTASIQAVQVWRVQSAGPVISPSRTDQQELHQRHIIPALCAKAGIPPADVRGPIISHRARSTIATQLYNAKEPIDTVRAASLARHRSPESTQHYAKITPNTPARAYNDAGYFARNVRTIEVLVDRDAVTSGQAASGQPWQYFDLGHGLHLHLLRAVSTSDGLRTMRLLHPQGIKQATTVGG
jgi:hypothetical protein